MKKGVALEKVLTTASKHDGLPCLLCYKIGEGVGEILMTNGGLCLEKWMTKMKRASTDARMDFMMTMLRQIIPGLSKMHQFGYSHGDLKPENICAREGHNGNIKFTLIDLGMSSKLPRLGQDTTKKSFRGNYIFASAYQIKNKRPT